VTTARFPLGQLLVTRGVLVALEALVPPGERDPERADAQGAQAGDLLAEFVRRHARGDWGELGVEDWRANDQALRDGSRLLSAYRLPTGVRVWVITEWDRSSTTILLPEDY
jgi:hypothetical protein